MSNPDSEQVEEIVSKILASFETQAVSILEKNSTVIIGTLEKTVEDIVLQSVDRLEKRIEALIDAKAGKKLSCWPKA